MRISRSFGSRPAIAASDGTAASPSKPPAAAGGFDAAAEGGATDVAIAGLDPKLREILNQPIEMIELSSRASNCLKVARIRTIGELVGKRDEELLAVKNFGKKSLDEIKDRLKDMGLSLGMQVGQAA